jgi:Protein of unknown function (DUF3306)
MSDSEAFVTRWSRLKREKSNEREARAHSEPDRVEAQDETGHARPSETEPAGAQLPEQPFDLSSLPSIESITAGTDIRAFLQSGVPADLTKAALRRAWSADPAIRDFIGLAENQWDFTDPSAIPGFGPLEPGDDLQKLVAQAMGKLEEASGNVEADGAERSAASHSGAAAPDARALEDVRSPAQVSGMPDRKEEGIAECPPVEAQDQAVSGALQHADARAESSIVPHRRGHGRALPQ